MKQPKKGPQHAPDLPPPPLKHTAQQSRGSLWRNRGKQLEKQNFYVSKLTLELLPPIIILSEKQLLFKSSWWKHVTELFRKTNTSEAITELLRWGSEQWDQLNHSKTAYNFIGMSSLKEYQIPAIHNFFSSSFSMHRRSVFAIPHFQCFRRKN